MAVCRNVALPRWPCLVRIGDRSSSSTPSRSSCHGTSMPPCPRIHAPICAAVACAGERSVGPNAISVRRWDPSHAVTGESIRKTGIRPGPALHMQDGVRVCEVALAGLPHNTASERGTERHPPSSAAAEMARCPAGAIPARGQRHRPVPPHRGRHGEAGSACDRSWMSTPVTWGVPPSRGGGGLAPTA